MPGCSMHLCMYLMGFELHSPEGCGRWPALRISFLRNLSLDPGLVHQIGDALFQIIDTVAHVVDPSDYLIGHGLKLVLHVLQQILYLMTGGVVYWVLSLLGVSCGLLT